jgi:hypothetical protein
MSANFRSLDEAINFHLQRMNSNTREIPMGSPNAVLTGKNQPFENSLIQSKGVLQWGFSTWGVESVTGLDSPQDRK